MTTVTLELIFEQGNRVLNELKNMREDMQQIKLRLSAVEMTVAGLSNDVAGLRGDIAHQWTIFDQHAARLEKLERHANIIQE